MSAIVTGGIGKSGFEWRSHVNAVRQSPLSALNNGWTESYVDCFEVSGSS